MSESKVRNDRHVGPVLKTGELADAVLETVQEDNPGKEILTEEHSSYLRIWVEDECVIRMDTLERMLGRPVTAGDIEINMPSFSGFIRTDTESIRFLASST